jgi:hypothetical protein
MRFLQLNANRSRAVHWLVDQLTRERGTSVLLMSEPNIRQVRTPGWLVDDSEDAAIMLRGTSMRKWGKGRGFVWAQVTSYTVFSCYISPNITTGEFERHLDDLASCVRTQGGPVIVAGDFNAKAFMWGSAVEDAKGRMLADWAAATNLVAMNRGEPTFERGGSTSVLDVTFCSPDVARRVHGWHVMEAGSTTSDHMPIEFEIAERHIATQAGCPAHGWRWAENKKDKLAEQMVMELGELSSPSAFEIQHRVEEMCDRILPKRGCLRNTMRAVFWWTGEVAFRRRDYLSKRRRLAKARRSATQRQQEDIIGNMERVSAQARKRLKKEIRAAKAKAWEKLQESVENDPWGKGYRIATGKFQKKTPLSLEERREAVAKLFPIRPIAEWPRVEIGAVEPFTTDELRAAALKLRPGKAPGPDGIPPEVIRLLVEVVPRTLLSLMNGLFAAARFPDEWKRAKLVLIPKAKSVDRKKLRPICLLDCLGKLYEHLIRKRLLEELEQRGGLSDSQFGFREGRSTVDATQEVMKFAKVANSGSWGRKDFCALTAVDVANAFNSASWQRIVEALHHKNMPPWTIAIVQDYLRDRWVEDDDLSIRVSCGVPQGSVLGPTLWNLLYDGVLRIEVPLGTKLVAFADDLAVLTMGRTEEELVRTTEDALTRTERWMEENSLRLEPSKTEAVLLIGGRRPRPISFRLGNNTITPQRELKYLGIFLDQKMNFSSHVLRATAKAEKLTAMLARLMPNLGRPSSTKRKLLAAVTTSVVLYGAEIWAEDLKKKKDLEILQRTQRRVLIRVIAAYRTISADAAQVIAGALPIDLLVAERVRLWKGKTTGLTRVEARKEIEAEWQRRWIEGGKGEWTRQLIPQIERWARRKHGNVDFHLTQVLSGHGCFASFLKKIGKKNTDSCWYCPDRDDAEHTLFRCPRWDGLRLEVMQKTAEWPEKENLVDLMLRSKEDWEAIAGMARKIMRTKEADERRLESGLTLTP